MKLFVRCGVALAWAIISISAEEPSSKRTAAQRLETSHLRETHAARMRFARERKPLPELGVYQDFTAVIHVHAEDAPHTKGTRPEVLAAAHKTGVRIVIFTDHGGPKPETWRGLKEGVLFIAGEENGGAGLLRIPAMAGSAPAETMGELKFLSHIEERYHAPSEGFAGMEIFNRHTEAILDRTLERYITGAATNEAQWKKIVDDFKEYPDEFFGAGCEYRPEIIAKWDEETQQRKFTGIAANDAHQNQIFRGTTFDPYEVSFRNVATHILARELSEVEVRRALEDGRAYVSHDWLCDAAGFSFGAVNNLGVFNMGDSVLMTGGTRILALTPLEAHLKLFRNGALIHEARGTNLTYKAAQPGAYRLEAWLPVDGEERPWIYSNPVYLRSPTLADLQLPSGGLGPNVETAKGISYVRGEEEDAPKHQLDVYHPKGITSAPVFFFIHGGAWKYGDRSQYPAIANRFAEDGMVVVVPSYRLAPKHPHPAQIEDVAAAFAWTIQHIAEYGGDPKQVYVGGHSAGGHLAALLTLDGKYLNPHGLSRLNIRGTIALSGVYDLTIGESLSSVFGSDPLLRKDASPLFHIQSSLPPFLVTYCQWDYPTLPVQARRFSAALKKAGAAVETIYVPGQNHISEMVHVPAKDDPTAAAVLGFIHSATSKR